MPSYPIKITAEVTEEFIEQVCDSAGTGCAYWADRGEIVQRGDGTVERYIIEFWDDQATQPFRRKAKLRPQDIAAAVEKILTPGQDLVGDYIVSYLKHLDAGDVDDDAADAIIQLAVFGEIVYG